MATVDYGAVLEDLRAKRDAMNELIAALENVSRLSAPAAIARAAMNGVGRSVGRSVGTNRVPTRRATRRKTHAPRESQGHPRRNVYDQAVCDAIRKSATGLSLTDVSAAVGAKPSSVFSTLQRLVQSGVLVKNRKLYRTANAVKEGLHR